MNLIATKDVERAEGGKTPEQIETVDDNPLKAEFHLSEGDLKATHADFSL